jgi:AraC family transcriptional regulator
MSSQPAIHPLDAVKDEWVLSSQIIHAGGLTVEHQVQPSGECEAPSGLTHHVLVFELGNVLRQVSRIGGREYDGPLLQGEILLIPAEASLFGACEMSDEILAFIIEPIFLLQVALETNCRYPERVEFLSVLKTYDPQIEFIALSVQREIQQARWGSSLYLESLANVLAIHLLRNYTSHPPKLREYTGGLAQSKLQRVLEYINIHLEHDIQLTDLADAADMSQCYFASLFKQSMGITPWQYVVQQRIERSKVLLRQGNNSIVEIAFQCGFNSQSHFTQQFRRLTGSTPKMYRNS